MSGDQMKIIASVCATLLVGVLGGGAVMGNDTTAQQASSDKLEKISESIHSIDKNTTVLVVQMENLIERVSDLEEADKHNVKVATK